MIMQKKVSFFCIKAAESVSFDYDIEKPQIDSLLCHFIQILKLTA